MIIHAIRHGKPHLGIFGTPHLTIETDEGTGKIPLAHIDEATLTLLHQTLPNTRVDNLQDLTHLHMRLNGLSAALHTTLELALLNATPQPWKLFGKQTITQIPRPLLTIARNTEGNDFFLFAPEATNIVHTLLSAEAVYDHLKTTLPNVQGKNGILHSTQDNDTILTQIATAITTTHQRYGIPLRIGVNFHEHGTLQRVETLTTRHNLIYIEHPFPLSEHTSYHTFTATHHHECFIATPSPELYQQNLTNALVLSYENAHALNTLLQTLPAAHRNLFLDAQPGIVSVAASLIIPALKFTLKHPTGKTIANELLTTQHAIRNARAKPQDL